MRKEWLCCVVLAGFGGLAAAQDAGTGHLYDHWWDADGDGLIGEAEFAQGWGEDEAGRFQTLDRDGDGAVDREELEALDIEADFAAWDADNSGALDRQEVRAGFFDAYDANRDNAWDAAEWEEASRNASLFGEGG